MTESFILKLSVLAARRVVAVEVVFICVYKQCLISCANV